MASKGAACVILNYNNADETIMLAKALDTYQAVSYVIMVDNNSKDNSQEKLTTLVSDKIRLLKLPENRGYGAGNNAGVFYAYYELGCCNAIICNPDVSFNELCVKSLLEVMNKESDIAVAAPVQYFPDGSMEKEYAWKIPTVEQWILSPEHMLHKIFWPSYEVEMLDRYRESKREYMEVECVPGAMLMVDTEIFVKSGGYDESNFLYCEETTLAIKMRERGLRTVLLINEKYIHRVSTTVEKNINGRVKRKALMMDSRCQFLRDWLKADRFRCWLGRRVADIAVLETWLDCVLCKDK